jgi:hypothetical protein
MVDKNASGCRASRAWAPWARAGSAARSVVRAGHRARGVTRRARVVQSCDEDSDEEEAETERRAAPRSAAERCTASTADGPRAAAAPAAPVPPRRTPPPRGSGREGGGAAGRELQARLDMQRRLSAVDFCIALGHDGAVRAARARRGPGGARARRGARRREAAPLADGGDPRTKWTRRVPHPVLIGHAVRLRLGRRWRPRRFSTAPSRRSCPSRSTRRVRQPQPPCVRWSEAAPISTG